jgi:putative membrane protein
MQEPMPNPYPPNVQAQLARERNRIAADRTLLSFIRNSVLLIGIGIGIDQVIGKLFPNALLLNIWFYIFDLTLVGLGVLNLLLAAWDYQGEINRLNQSEYYFTPRWSLSKVTGITLFFLGFLIFVRLGVEILIQQFG